MSLSSLLILCQVIGCFSRSFLKIVKFFCSALVIVQDFLILLSISLAEHSNEVFDVCWIVSHSSVQETFNVESEAKIMLLQINHIIRVKVALLKVRRDIWIVTAKHMKELDAGVKGHNCEDANGHNTT